MTKPHFTLIDSRFEKAREEYALACKASRDWTARLKSALEEFGDYGPQISGCGREHFPAHVKEELRALARAVGAHSDKAMAARPRKVQRATMRALYGLIADRDGCGFYGPINRHKSF